MLQAPEDFVLLTDLVPQAIQQIRYHSCYNFIGERIDGYDQPLALLTRAAAEALQAATADFLQAGYYPKIFDTYRPQTAVDHFVRWAQNLDDTRMKACFYPQVDKSCLFQEGYIAMHSGHSRGSTIDLTLVNMYTGKEIDMGGPFDYFGELSHADYTGALTTEQLANRQLLRSTMLRHGFRGITSEWWHFTLKNEPYPDTYFSFPVNMDSLLR